MFTCFDNTIKFYIRIPLFMYLQKCYNDIPKKHTNKQNTNADLFYAIDQDSSIGCQFNI